MNLSPALNLRLCRSAHNSSNRMGIAWLSAVIAMLLLGSSVLSFGQDEQPSAIQVPLVLRRHVMLPSPAPADPSQPREKPVLRVAPAGNSVSVATGTGVVYTCASNVAASTCTYLNTVVAGYYNDVFTNANANIYVQYGATGLGSSSGFINLVPYTPYVTALTNMTNKSSVQTSSLSSVNTYATPVYGTQNSMEVTVALGSAFGFSGLKGINVAETASCTPYTANCYNEIVTVADAATQAQEGFTLYYDDQGGTETAGQYDFYAVVEHETDEVLGTSSCISTQSSSLSDECDFAGGTGVPSAVDLDRFSSPGVLAKDTAPSTTTGQYFSYDGGAHYGLYGFANTPKVYNTISNGQDFADYIPSSPDCGTNQAVQDATGCPGEDQGLTVLNDGESELTILNAIGFKVPEAVISSPTPGSTLSGTSATFTWSAVSGATDYWVYVGSTGVGSSNIFANTAAITATSQAVTGLPTTGTVYVRVYSYVGSFWTSIDYTYQTGTAVPAVTLTPTGLTFASTNVGSTTAAQTVTVKNTGTGTLTLTSETITGTNASSFLKSATTCGSSLAAGASCTVSVEFKPVAAGALTGSLSVADNASGSPQAATLNGTGVGVPAVTLTPTGLTFASTTVGSTTAAQAVTVKNTGTGTLTLTSETITGTNASSFLKSATTCGSSLAAGASCTVSVEFKPTATGALTASLSVADNASGSPQAATLNGSGTTSTSGVTLSATSLSFPETAVGKTSVAQAVVLKNTGTVTVTISSIALGGTNATSFQEIGTCGASLAAGASCSTYVGFHPTSAAALSGTLIFTDNATGSPQQVTLTGTGTTTPVVTLSATSLSFPTTAHGSTSQSQKVTITNSGAVPLTMWSFNVTGTNPTDFIDLTTCGPTLAPAASCAVYVAFKPAAAAAYTATVTIIDTGASSPQLVTLSGTGN